MYKLTIHIGQDKLEYHFKYDNKLECYLQCFEDDFNIEFFCNKNDKTTNLTLKEAMKNAELDMVYCEGDNFSGYIESFDTVIDYRLFHNEIDRYVRADKMNRAIAQ